MIHEKNHFIKHLHAKIGGGGFFCTCCTGSDSKGRKAMYRARKRNLRQQVKKEILVALDD